ncbi:MAG: hypothetical protein ACFFDU_09020 [Candidatus Thorarchaeota archaeon]
MAPSALLAAGIGIIVDEKKLLVCETPESKLELPAFIVAKANEAISNLNKELTRWNLIEYPQQTLYLTAVTLNTRPEKTVMGLIQIIRFSDKPEIIIPNSRYEAIDQLWDNEQATALIQAVTKWLSMTY